nr:hypothetical protein [Tanacetum cinerariifolium]
MPAKCLARSRLCFHVLESLQTRAAYHTDVLVPKKGPFLEFLRKKPLSKSSTVIIHPLKKECYELPPLLMRFDTSMFRESCGLGFDASTNTLKMVCVLLKDYVPQVYPDMVRKNLCMMVHIDIKTEDGGRPIQLPPLPMRFDTSMFRESCGLGFDASTNTLKMVCVLLKDYVPQVYPDMVRKNPCTMVHVCGTNSWREIPQVSPYSITDGAVFANGCLHWLVSHIDIKTEDGGRPVIWFDIEKEEFG